MSTEKQVRGSDDANAPFQKVGDHDGAVTSPPQEHAPSDGQPGSLEMRPTRRRGAAPVGDARLSPHKLPAVARVPLAERFSATERTGE